MIDTSEGRVYIYISKDIYVYPLPHICEFNIEVIMLNQIREFQTKFPKMENLHVLDKTRSSVEGVRVAFLPEQHLNFLLLILKGVSPTVKVWIENEELRADYELFLTPRESDFESYESCCLRYQELHPDSNYVFIPDKHEGTFGKALIYKIPEQRFEHLIHVIDDLNSRAYVFVENRRLREIVFKYLMGIVN